MRGDQERWDRVDAYIADRLVHEDETLRQALAASDAAGLDPISVAPPQGKLLHLFARMVRARRILEVGTLGGYSTIWLARALPPDGRLVTLEVSPLHAEVARANLDRAGLGDRVEVRVGPALETLPKLAAAGEEPFDLVFIDADKTGYPDYFSWAVRLSRPGGVIIADNAVRGGAVAEPGAGGPAAEGVRRMFDAMAAEPRVEATAVQTVGTKGYDGFAIAVVTDGGGAVR